MQSLDIHSFNVRGLRQAKNRQAVFIFFKQKHKGIIFLQETHSIESDEIQWKKDWGGDIIFAHGSTTSRGVATLIPKTYDANFTSIKTDDKGRFIIAEGSVLGEEISLVNIYAPTKDKTAEQIDFFNTLVTQLDNCSLNTIIGGDFNICLRDIDKSGGRKEPVSGYATAIKNFMEACDYVDVWRLHHPNEKRYTWRESNKNGLIQSRLDFWLIPVHMLYNLNYSEINCGILSDHSIITLSFTLNEPQKRGRGFWKFNTQLLTDKVYTERVKECIEQCNTKHANLENKGLLWDTMKMEIRGISISYASHKAKINRENETALYIELNKLEKLLASEPSIETKNQYTQTKRELESINNKKTLGVILRAKALNVEFNEKNSSFFIKQEQKHSSQKHIKCIERDDGTLISDANEILNEEKIFYEKLYSDETTHSVHEIQEANTYCLNNIDNNNKLNDEDKTFCEKAITPEEIAKAVKELLNNKSPGSDGFPIEFYKFFWADIKEYVIDSIIFAIEHGELSIEQKRAILSLIPKKGKNIRSLKNWRPISLLNTDYKIIAKVLANRLQSVLPHIISPDQSGYLKGRNIGNNLRNILDIIEYTKEFNIEGMIIFVDFEKAFDTVQWDFLQKCLLIFNF